MWFRRIGGTLIAGGCVLNMITIATVVVGSSDLEWIVPGGGLVLISLGAITLCVAGTKPIDGRAIRVGLGMLGVGLLSYLSGNVLPVREGSNNLQSWPHIILLFGGVVIIVLGFLVTLVSLVRAPGPSRAVGSVLFLGLLLFPIAGLLSAVWTDEPFRSIVTGLVVLGSSGIFLGLIGIGGLAIVGDRSGPVAVP